MQEQLNQMSVTEKLITINKIWDSLIQSADDVPTPAWHKDILAARLERVANGVSSFKPLATVKEELRSKFR